MTVLIRKCRICGKPYEKKRMGQIVCSPACAIEHTKRQNAKKEMERKREERTKVRAAKSRLKTRNQWMKEAQAAVNRYIRLRDAGKPCISCGKPWQENFQAGHYVPAGRGAALRFEPDNIHGQCPQCNLYESGNLLAYRRGLIERIGLERTEALEACREVKSWTVEELQAVKAEFQAKAKELGNG